MCFLLKCSISWKQPLTDYYQTKPKSTNKRNNLEKPEVWEYLYKQLLRMDFKSNLQSIRVVFKIEVRRQPFN